MKEHFGAPWTISKIETYLVKEGKQISLTHIEDKNKEEYCSTKEPLQAKCLRDGYTWSTNIKRLYRGQGCAECAGNVKLTYEQMKQRVEQEKPTVKVISTKEVYSNTHERITVKCLIHDHVWTPTPNHIFNGEGCILCGHVSTGNASRANYHETKHKVEEKGLLKLLTPQEEFEKISARVKVQCTVCDHVWNPYAYSLTNKGRGCPECAKLETARKNTRTYEDVKNLMNNKGFTLLTPKEEYTNTEMKVTLQCIEHGHIWSPKVCSIVSGSGCPDCAKLNHPGTYTIGNAEKNKKLWLTQPTNVYILKCWDSTEEFYKIGITKYTTNTRFSGAYALPYDKEQLYYIKLNKYIATYLEKTLHEHFNPYRIIPNKYFPGYTECFAKLPNIEQILEDKIKQLSRETST